MKHLRQNDDPNRTVCAWERICGAVEISGGGVMSLQLSSHGKETVHQRQTQPAPSSVLCSCRFEQTDGLCFLPLIWMLALILLMRPTLGGRSHPAASQSCNTTTWQTVRLLMCNMTATQLTRTLRQTTRRCTKKKGCKILVQPINTFWLCDQYTSTPINSVGRGGFD